MFTISKLFWLFIILLAVSNLFRIIEKRQALKDRNKYYSKSNFKIDCDNHKKNEIVDRIVSILKKNEIKS